MMRNGKLTFHLKVAATILLSKSMSVVDARFKISMQLETVFCMIASDLKILATDTTIFLKHCVGPIETICGSVWFQVFLRHAE